MRNINHLRSIIIVIILLSISLSQVNADELEIDVVFEFYGPIWDINHDGITNFLDVSSMVSHYGETNVTAGWIRDDMNGPTGEPDGDIDFLDVSMLVTHYTEEWLVT